MGSIYALYAYLVQRFDPFHIWLLIATAAVMVVAIFAALAGVDMAVCLAILVLAPTATIVGYETLGHRHQAEALANGGASTTNSH